MTEQIETLEEALDEVADVISADSFSDFVRKGLESGLELNYRLIIKQEGQGIVVSLLAEKKMPARNIKTLIRLQ
jgi:hypothetical protein